MPALSSTLARKQAKLALGSQHSAIEAITEHQDKLGCPRETALYVSAIKAANSASELNCSSQHVTKSD